MSKKRIIILTIIGVLIVGSIIGIMRYRNTPGYVMKQYVKALSSGDYIKMIELEYNYDDYNISNHHYDSYVISQIKLISKSKDRNYINEHTAKNFFYLPDSSKIKKIYIYQINNNKEVVVGNVNNKWMVVSSSFYTLTK